jgi:hypothetical protein
VARITVPLESGSVILSPDGPVRAVDRIWGLVGMRVVDELTGTPPRSPIILTTRNPRLWPRVADDGVVGVAGVPRDVFPSLTTTGYTVEMGIRARGYTERSVLASVPADPAYPESYTPLYMPDLLLHRLPVVITGRVVRAVGGAMVPIAAATVRVIGIWRNPPPAGIVVPAAAPDFVHLDPALYADRDSGIGRLCRGELTPVAGSDKLLLDPRPAGSRTIGLSNATSLSVGGMLCIDADVRERAEYIMVHVVEGGSTSDQAAEATLEHPLQYLHREGAPVRMMTLQPPGPDNTMTEKGIAGDETVFLNAMNGLGTAIRVRIRGGSGADEYHRVSLYTVTSNADGYYRLPPISRVAQVSIEAADGVHPPVRTVISPDYEQHDNVVDFVFR